MGKWVKTGFDFVVCDDTHSGTKVPAVEYMRSGVCSIIDQGQDFIAGYSDDMAAAYRNLPAIVFGDHTRVLKFVDFPFLLGADGAKILRPATDKLDCKFLFYYLLQHPVPSTGYNRHYSWMRRMQVEYPAPLDEQRHIAEILTTCDEVIEKSEAVAEKYRAIKAGMLKDLFTRGIGRNGKLRPTPESAPQLYKDTALGKVPREWEVKMLGDDDVSCVNPSSQQLPERFVYVDLESVESGKLLHENEIERGTAPSRAQRVVADGDILYQLVRPYQKNNLLFRRRGRLEYVASTGYAQIRAKHDARFLYQYLHEEAFLNRVLCLCTGTGYPAITPCNLSGIFIKVPDPAEQRQIAERLSAIDAKISDELAVIAKYRKVKAGLMARLLTPPPDVEIVDGGVE